MLVYKFCKKDTGECVYIGSTKKQLSRRLTNHKYDAKVEPIPFHNYVLENGGWDAYEISVVEDCGEIDNLSLRMRERYWYDQLKPLCNIMRPYVSSEDSKTYRKTYHNNNREEENAKNKEYYDTNRDAILARRRARKMV